METHCTSALILIILKRDVGYAVYCDASLNDLGHVLIQEGRVVVYGFDQLKLYKINYLSHDLELAIKVWRHYLYGEHFDVFFHHKSLKCIFTQLDLNLRQYCCMKYLEDCRLNSNIILGKEKWLPMRLVASPIGPCLV